MIWTMEFGKHWSSVKLHALNLTKICKVHEQCNLFLKKYLECRLLE